MGQAQTTRVLVVDERQLMRDLLCNALSSAEGIEVCGTADSLDSALAYVARNSPDVVVFGVAHTGSTAEEFVHAILLACSSTVVMALAPIDTDTALFSALRAGAIGFVTHDSSLSELVGGVHSAAARETVLPADFARRMLRGLEDTRTTVLRRTGAPELTARELEILELLTQGCGNAEIARKLGVSINTVKNHLYSIYRKMGVTSRGQAFATAAQLGLVAG